MFIYWSGKLINAGRRKFDLEAVHASLMTTCAHCCARIGPEEYKRVDGEHLECPQCTQKFRPGAGNGRNGSCVSRSAALFDQYISVLTWIVPVFSGLSRELSAVRGGQAAPYPSKRSAALWRKNDENL
jgi:hypothetical protein